MQTKREKDQDFILHRMLSNSIADNLADKPDHVIREVILLARYLGASHLLPNNSRVKSITEDVEGLKRFSRKFWGGVKLSFDLPKDGSGKADRYLDQLI